MSTESDLLTTACMGYQEEMAVVSKLHTQIPMIWLMQVPMRQVTLDAMEGLLQRYRGRYTAVVGFQPTGWTHGRAGRGGQAEHGSVKQATRSSSSVRPSKRLQRGTVVLYQVNVASASWIIKVIQSLLCLPDPLPC